MWWATTGLRRWGSASFGGDGRAGGEAARRCRVGRLYLLGGITLASFLVLPGVTHAHATALLCTAGMRAALGRALRCW